MNAFLEMIEMKGLKVEKRGKTMDSLQGILSNLDPLYFGYPKFVAIMSLDFLFTFKM